MSKAFFSNQQLEIMIIISIYIAFAQAVLHKKLIAIFREFFVVDENVRE